MTYYEKLKEAITGIGDVTTINQDTNEVSGIGAAISDDYSVIVDNNSGAISFIHGPAEVLILHKNGPVMQMLNAIYEGFE